MSCFNQPSLHEECFHEEWFLLCCLLLLGIGPLWTKTDGHGEMWPLLTGQKLYLVCRWRTFLGAHVPACHIRAGPCRWCFGCTTGWVWKKGVLLCTAGCNTVCSPGTKTGVTEEGFLGCTSVHAHVRSVSRTTTVSSPKKDSATDRTHNMDDILVYSALLLWHTKVSVFFWVLSLQRIL